MSRIVEVTDSEVILKEDDKVVGTGALNQTVQQLLVGIASPVDIPLPPHIRWIAGNGRQFILERPPSPRRLWASSSTQPFVQYPYVLYWLDCDDSAACRIFFSPYSMLNEKSLLFRPWVDANEDCTFLAESDRYPTVQQLARKCLRQSTLREMNFKPDWMLPNRAAALAKWAGFTEAHLYDESLYEPAPWPTVGDLISAFERPVDETDLWAELNSAVAKANEIATGMVAISDSDYYDYDDDDSESEED